MEYSFPQYRKYATGTSYFKIESLEVFEEVQLMGSRKLVHRIEAKIHPDRMRILDMLNNHENAWVVIDAAEFEASREGGG